MIYEQHMATIANQGPSAWAPNKSKVCDHKLPYLVRWAGPFGRLIVWQLSICSGRGWKSPRYVVGLTVSRCCCVVYVPLCLARFGCKPRKILIGGTVRWVNCDNRNRVSKGHVWVVGSKKSKIKHLYIWVLLAGGFEHVFSMSVWNDDPQMTWLDGEIIQIISYWNALSTHVSIKSTVFGVWILGPVPNCEFDTRWVAPAMWMFMSSPTDWWCSADPRDFMSIWCGS